MSFALQKGFFICVMTHKKIPPVLLYFTVTRMTWKYNLPHSAFRLEINHSFLYFAYTTLHEMLLGTQGVGYIKTIEINKAVLIQENNFSLFTSNSIQGLAFSS